MAVNSMMDTYLPTPAHIHVLYFSHPLSPDPRHTMLYFLASRGQPTLWMKVCAGNVGVPGGITEAVLWSDITPFPLFITVGLFNIPGTQARALGFPYIDTILMPMRIDADNYVCVVKLKYI
jgi:hypothetical protein